MEGFPLLTAVLLAPVSAALLLCFVSSESVQSVRVICAAAMTFALVLTVYAFFSYDMSAGGMQFTEDVPGLGIWGCITPWGWTAFPCRCCS